DLRTDTPFRSRWTRALSRSILADDRGPTIEDCLFQIRHLYSCECCFKPLVTHFQTSAIDRLLQRVAGQNTKGVRDSCLLRRLPNTTRYLVDDDVVVSRVTAQQTTKADDRVVFASLSERARSRGNFEGTGYPD